MMIDIYNIVNDYAICWEPQMVVVYINFDNIFWLLLDIKKSWIKFFLFVENEKRGNQDGDQTTLKIKVNIQPYYSVLLLLLIVIQ